MQASGGRGHRAALRGIDSLVALAIVRAVLPPDVGRQGHVAELVEAREKILDWGKTQLALPKAPAGGDRGGKRRPIGRRGAGKRTLGKNDQFLSDRKLARGASKSPPLPLVQLLCEQDFDFPGSARLLRKEPGRDHPAPVEDEEIARMQELRQVVKHAVAPSSGSARETEHPALSASGRLLRDQFRRKLEIEIGDQHILIVGKDGRQDRESLQAGTNGLPASLSAFFRMG